MSSIRGRGRPSLEIDEETVLRTALETFAEQGLEATSMERIAESCGVAKTTLHDRFGGKNVLFEKALAQEHERFSRHMLAAYGAGESLDVQGQLRNGFRAFFEYARDNPVLFRYLFGGPDDATLHSSSAMRSRETVLAAITGMVERQSAAAGRSTGLSSELIADVILGSGEYVARRVATEPGIDIEASTEFVVQVLSVGIFSADSELP